MRPQTLPPRPLRRGNPINAPASGPFRWQSGGSRRATSGSGTTGGVRRGGHGGAACVEHADGRTVDRVNVDAGEAVGCVADAAGRRPANAVARAAGQVDPYDAVVTF